MELVSNLLQFIVTLLGFSLSGIRYLKSRTQAYFLLTCFYGCFALGSLYWTLYLLLYSETPQVFYVSEFGWVAFLRGGKGLCVPQSPNRPLDRRSAVRALLHLWRHPLQSALVRFDDRCFLSCDPWPCLCSGAGRDSTRYAIFSHWGAVLCGGGICFLDFRLLLAGGFHFQPLLLA